MSRYDPLRDYLQSQRASIITLSFRDIEDLIGGHCQTNLNGPAKGAGLRRSGRQLTPLGQGGRTVLFEDVAAVEVAVVVEVVVD